MRFLIALLIVSKILFSIADGPTDDAAQGTTVAAVSSQQPDSSDSSTEVVSTPEPNTSDSSADQATTDDPNSAPDVPQRVYNNPHFVNNSSVIVHLHEWTYKDIARECEEFLGPKGYAAVQTSPASENLVMKGRPWYERYQPISYQIITRSGNANDFYDMTRRCNRVGVRIYVDVIPNHMSGNADNAVGTGGTLAQPNDFDYQGVPYTKEDFHPPCSIEDFDDPVQARVCELVGLHDLDQSRPRVQWAIVNFLDRLTALGAAGFRVDATKHMSPEDLVTMYNNLHALYKRHGFEENALPFIYQEVGDGWKFNYTRTGAVTEFAHATNMAAFFKNKSDVTALRDYGGEKHAMLDSANALVFVDNHDLQRQNAFTLNYKQKREFKAAYGFTLAHPYGIARVMSSFDFKDDQQGPPHDVFYNIRRPLFNRLGQCFNGWVCEHRWPAIATMVRFRNAVAGEPLQKWWDDSNGVLSFCRGNRGFFAVSAGRYDFEGALQTCLPAGIYCNAFAERLFGGACKKEDKILVKENGSAWVKIPKNSPELMVALLSDDIVERDPFQ